MAQTTIKDYLYFADGTKVSVKASGEVSYTDIGALGSDTTCTLEWVENQFETANAGKTDKQIGEMTISGGFTLINLDPANIERLSGGAITKTSTAASPVATIPDQDIAAGWSDNTKYELIMYTSSSDTTKLKTTTKPTLTSVTLDPDGTPEVLTENNDYVIVADAGSYSGWSLIPISAGMTTGSPTTFIIRIDYGSNTPVASDTLKCGSASVILAAYALKFTHTDSAGLVRELELYSVDPNSGGFQFNYKSAASDGVEEMPLSFTAKLDTSRTDGDQLFSYTVNNGAK